MDRSTSCLTLALLFAAATLAGAQTPSLGASKPAAVVLRGTLSTSGPNEVQFVADLSTLGSATLAGVRGSDLMASRGRELLRQGEIYRLAQISAGTPAEKTQPLYVLLDPRSDWAFAQPWATFSYVQDGKKVGPITAPLLLMGEVGDYQAHAQRVTPDVVSINRELIERLGAAYREARAQGPARPGREPDFAKDVLEGVTLITATGRRMNLVEAAGDLSTKSWLEFVAGATKSDLASRRLDGEAGWAAMATKADTEGALVRGLSAATRQGLAATLAHEMGHVIHFATLGLYGYKGWGSAPHMNGSNHSFATLSTPEFAFVEGWAEAHAMIVAESSRGADAGAGNRIDYSYTVAVVEQKLAQAAGTDAAARAEREHLASVKAYVDGLQARKGQLRSRYDALRSEHFVATTLAGLREERGPEIMPKVLGAMAKHKPATLAALLEHMAHDDPGLRTSLYRSLAKLTEGILVTEAQAAWVEAQTSPFEIDLDRDGKTPGPTAKDPAAFPAEAPPLPGNPDPLRFVAPGVARAGAGPAVTDHRGQDQVVVVRVVYGHGEDLVAGGPSPDLDDLIRR